MRKIRKVLTILAIFCAILSLSILSTFSQAAQQCENWMAKVVSIQGDVKAKKSGSAVWTTVDPEDTYCPGDSIRVAEKGRAALLFRNDSVLRMDQNTTVTLVGLEQGKTSVLELLMGVVLFLPGHPQDFGSLRLL